MYPTETFGSAPFEIIDGDRGKAYPKQNEFHSSGHCIFLSATNVTKTGFDFGSGQFIDDQKDAQLRKGKLERENERLLVIKTTAKVWPRLRDRIRRLATYEVPEILAVEASAVEAEYLAWLVSAVAPGARATASSKGRGR